jgi:signal transduction histidine kinase
MMEQSLEEVFIVVAASAFFLLMAIGVVVLFQVYAKRQLKMRLEKQEMESRFQAEILKARIEEQEKTMDHISKELHDNIGQLLSSSKFLVGLSKRTLPNSAETLVEADHTLGIAINELRALSKSFNKEWLAQFSLIENLQNEINRINASKEFVASLKHPEELYLSVDKQLILFRIIQECLQNAIKHAVATHFDIVIDDLQTSLAIFINDNGIGFDPELSSKHGIGITNIKHRVSILSGVVEWRSQQGGTTVYIKIPV